MKLRIKVGIAAFALLVLVAALPAAAQQPISLFVEATDIGRKLFHAELAIPVRPGPLTLVYPKWVPGYHAPVGPLNNMVRLKMIAGGRSIGWRRDPLDVFAFHIVVPKGVATLNVVMDVVAPTQPEFTFGAASARLFVLEWNNVVLYPAGVSAGKLPVRARVRLPQGWKYACVVPTTRSGDSTIELATVSLRRLVDSPLLSGEYFKTVQVSGGPTPVFLDMGADDPKSLEITPQWLTHFQRFVAESEALFGGPPYRQYHFLLALSDALGDDGVEHRECSDNRVHARMFSDDSVRLSYGYLFPHEFAHAWNGKFRYPKGLATRDFQQPQTDEMLWVYEGLTRYLNWVLAARSGLFSPQEARDYAAILAAGVDHRSGREWRSLRDTAVSAPLLYFAPDSWQSLRRSLDYYDESLFIWLEADIIIRRHTGGKRSLGDFCRAFFGPDHHGGSIYDFRDVVTALNAIAEYDWARFFEKRLDATGTGRTPLGGLTASGWNLVYGSEIGSVQSAREKIHATADERFSWGLLIRQDGTIADIVRDSPAWKAGLGPGMKINAINGHAWSLPLLRETVAADRQSPARLTVRNGSATVEAVIEDRRGARYPRLERNAEPDLMSDILRPRTTQ